MRDATALAEFLRASLAHGATYRLRQQAWDGTAYAPLRRQVEAVTGAPLPTTADGRVDVPLSPALTPCVLPAVVTARLRALGPVLVAALRAVHPVYQHVPAARSVVGSGRRREDDDPTRADPFVGHWIRVDYAIETTRGSPRPVAFDVNLMPGMTHVAAAVDRLHAQTFGRPPVAPGTGWRSHDPAPLDRLRARAARQAGRDEVAFLVRGGHGLVPDVRLAARGIEETTGCSGRVLRAQDPWPDRAPGAVVRQLRRYSKHVGPRRAQEEASLTALQEAVRAGATLALPGFHLGLESHAWPYLWRIEPFRSLLVEALGSAGFAALDAAFPATGVVSDGRVHWPDAEEELTEAVLAERVVKTADSTGAEGVVVLSGRNRGRRRYRQEALARMAQETRAGHGSWVVQDFVAGERETVPVVGSEGSTVQLTGTTRYAAYYADGEYLGGYALLSPTSRMVHGGAGSVWVPLIEAIALGEVCAGAGVTPGTAS